jgi:hypothetical protein
VDSIRFARNTSAAVVAAIAAWSSYSHMVHVALHYGERAEVAYVLPFSVDGMLVVASVAMVDDRRAGRKVRPVARAAFTAGVIASVAANVGAAQPTAGARIVAAWPALALLLVVEMLSRSGRAAEQPCAALAEPTPALQTEPAIRSSSVPTMLTSPPFPDRQLEADGQTATTAPRRPFDAPVRTSLGRSVSVAADQRMAELPVAPPGAQSPEVPPPRTGAEPRTPNVERRNNEHNPRRRRRPTEITRRLATDMMAAQPHLTRSEIANRLGVSTRRLREVLATR